MDGTGMKRGLYGQNRGNRPDSAFCRRQMDQSVMKKRSHDTVCGFSLKGCASDEGMDWGSRADQSAFCHFGH